MDVHDRMLSLAGRDVLFRPIEFERYRKPHIVEYPRHATVLNPQHTRQQSQHMAQSGKVDQAATSSSSSSDSDADGETNQRKKVSRTGAHINGEEDDSDDDDPRHMSRTEYLCSDSALAKVLHLRWRDVGPVGVGLVNLGNTCFANSVLQAISYTPALAQFFADTYRVVDGQLGAPYDFAFSLGETIRQVHLRRTTAGNGSHGSSHQYHQGAYRPGLIVGHLRALSNHFSLGKQSDAHEFAVQLLFGCQKSILHRLVGSRKLPLRVSHTTPLSRICGGYLRSQVAWSRQDEIQQLLKAGKRQAATDLKMELRNAQGSRHKDRMTSNTYDPSNIMHVELAGQTLEHCLAKFCEIEKLHGRCYHSPRDVPVIATKQLKVHVPPNVLIIHLKRFNHTGGKVSKYIEYPLRFDLYPYTTECEVEPRRAAGSSEERPRSQYLYELNALCVHEGSSINYGHYYAVVRARNGAWYECNDASVVPLSQEKALRQQAYMLFYSQVPTERGKAVQKQRQNGHVRGSVAASATFIPKRPAVPTPKDDVGEELSEEQVAALLASRKKQSTGTTELTPLNSAATQQRVGAGSEGVEMATAKANDSRGKNKFNPQTDDVRRTFKRHRGDLSTEEDEDDGRDTATAAPATVDGELRPNTARRDSSNGEIPSEPSAPAASTKSSRRAVHGGVVKSMYINPTTPLPRGVKPRHNGQGVSEDLKSPPPQQQQQTRALGRAALIALEEQKQLTTPATVKRDVSAPKFQQRIRDPMWEMEMDKGRVKKVKKKDVERSEDGGKVNVFQERSKNRFDTRGRRLQEDERKSE